MAFVCDGFNNSRTGLGGAAAKNPRTGFERPAIGRVDALELYNGDAIAARIADQRADDATRLPFEIEGRESETKALLGADFLGALADADRWSRVFGGAAIVALGPEDGGTLAPGSASGFQVLDSSQLTPADVETKLGPNFLRPRSYVIEAEGDVTLDADRVYRFDAQRIAPSQLKAGQWGPSVYDRIWSALSAYGAAHESAAELLHSASLLILKLEKFREKHDTEKGTEQMDALLSAMRDGVDSVNILGLDSKDELYELSRNLSGVDALLGRFAQALVATGPMPAEILLGITAGGLNTGTNEGAFRAWYNHLEGWRGKSLSPAVQWAARMMFGEAERVVSWPSLWEPTAKEQAETEKLKAETEKLRTS